jgi:AraC-like DNA-binding protein
VAGRPKQYAAHRLQQRASVEHIYREIRPSEPLREHLLCLWTETTDDRPPGSMRVLPDGCIDVVLIAGSSPIVAGPATQAAFPVIPPGSTLVGARIRPGMAASLLGMPAHELADAEVPLAAIWGDRFARPDGRFDASRLAADGIDDLQALLIGRLMRPEDSGDQLVRAAARTLIREPGTLLDVVADRAGLSDRQLRRRFEAAIGYGPKTFQRIMRFRQWLDRVQAMARDQRRLVDLAAEAGYADQAHLTREVTRLAGHPPTALLAEAASG